MLIHTLDSKTNFVDKNNVLVGWDTAQDCCEHACWYVVDEKSKRFDEPLRENEDKSNFDLTDYVFDRDYFDKKDTSGENSDVEALKVAFRLVAKGKPNLYLVLSNSHNGYYKHGFNVEVGGKTIWEGYL